MDKVKKMTKYRLKKRFYFYDGDVCEPQELRLDSGGGYFAVDAQTDHRWFAPNFVESNIAQGNLVRNQTVEEVLAILAKYEHFLSNPVAEIKEELEKLKG